MRAGAHKAHIPPHRQGNHALARGMAGRPQKLQSAAAKPSCLLAVTSKLKPALLVLRSPRLNIQGARRVSARLRTSQPRREQFDPGQQQCRACCDRPGYGSNADV